MNKKIFVLVLVLLSAVIGFFLVQNLKSNFNFGFFRATMVPNPSPLFGDSEINLSEINLENLLPEETEPAPGLKLEPLSSEAPRSGAEEDELTLAELQEILDDIAERVDEISQEVAELIEESQPALGETSIKGEELALETKPKIELTEEELGSEEIGQGVGQEENIVERIDINTASLEDLQKLVGIGPVLAQRIIEARPFYSLNDLIKVQGIGEATLQKIKEQGLALVTATGGGGGGGGGVPSATSYPIILILEIQIEEDDEKYHDFIELFNPNDFDVYLKEYRLVKRTKGSSGDTTVKSWSREDEAKISAFSYYLWVSNKDKNYSLLSEADASTSQTISEDNGIALRYGEENTGLIIDAVGWGDFNNILFEGNAFPQNPKTYDPVGEWLAQIGFKGWREPDPRFIYHLSLGRKLNEQGKHEDIGDNALDFEIQIPTPKKPNETFEPKELIEILREIDSAPPEVIIDSWPEELTHQNQATFYFHTTEENCSFECKLNDQDWSSCQSPITYSDLSDGQHVFSVRANDLFSNLSQPVQYPWTIEEVLKDTTPPEVIFDLEPIQTSLSFEISWSGVDLLDNVTPSGIDGFRFRYSLDKENWTYWPEDLSFTQETQYNFTGEDEKIYYFQIKAKDIAENESDWLPEPPAFTKISLPKNFLQNPYFDEWVDNSPEYWESDHGRIIQSDDAFVGNYSMLISHDYAYSGGKNDTQKFIHEEANKQEVTYYGEVWVKGYGDIRIGIVRPGYTLYSYSSWEVIDTDEWIKITHEITKDSREGIEGGFRVQHRRSKEKNDTSLFIGAAWLSTTKPPENWPL